MKLIVAILSALLTGVCSYAQHQSAIGIDISSAIKTRQIEVSGSYGFGKKWSASYSGDFQIRIPGKETDMEYEEHVSEFNASIEYDFPLDNHHIAVEYWTEQAYEGLYLQIGCRCNNDIQVDCTVGAGFCIHIWKGLSVTLSYMKDLMGSFKAGAPTGKGANITLNWIINKE